MRFRQGLGQALGTQNEGCFTTHAIGWRSHHASDSDRARLIRHAAHERTAGFIEALHNRGIELPAGRIIEAGYTFESGVAAAEKLLLGKQRPTAIFTGNDEMAAGVYKVAMRAGINIPRDLSVVGYDDSPLAARLWPSLTSVRRQTRDTGRIAATMLIRTDTGPLPVASVRPHLIVRDSCQPPA